MRSEEDVVMKRGLSIRRIRAEELTGMVMMAVAGAGCAVTITLSTMIDVIDLPYFTLVGFVGLSIALPLIGLLVRSGEIFKLTLSQWRWVWVRGFFGMGAYLACILAAAAGAPVGDVSALTSTSIVVAAFLGLAILDERLGALHCAVIVLSIAGAVLVAEPESLFNGREDTPLLLGHALAILAGCFSGTLFIAARKSIGINPQLLTASVMLQESVTLLILPHTGLVNDRPFEKIFERPARAVVFTAVMGLMFGGTCACISVGAQMCPARMSSTISTCVQMTLSYIAQIVVHGQKPTASTLTGAVMMTVAVAVMAATPSHRKVGEDKPALGAPSADELEGGKVVQVVKSDQMSKGITKIDDLPPTEATVVRTQ